MSISSLPAGCNLFLVAREGSVLNVCCQLLFSSFQSPNRTYLHLFFALIGFFGIEKPVRFELKPVRFGILKKLSR